MTLRKLKQEAFQSKVEEVKNCWVLIFRVNLILIRHGNHFWFKTREKIMSSCQSYSFYDIRQKIVFKSLFNAQFNHCHLFWMFHSRKKIIKSSIYLEDLQGQSIATRKNILEKDKSISIHHKNIQVLVLQILKINHKLCPEINCDILNCLANSTVFEVVLIL